MEARLIAEQELKEMLEARAVRPISPPVEPIPSTLAPPLRLSPHSFDSRPTPSTPPPPPRAPPPPPWLA
eukprot:SAG11_NODE_1955_length_4005_cov_2.390937_3_plen_69_part_00